MMMLAVVPMAFFGDPRFKVPVIPFLILLVASLFGVPDPVEGAAPGDRALSAGDAPSTEVVAPVEETVPAKAEFR